jgi:hypothetical protein
MVSPPGTAMVSGGIVNVCFSIRYGVIIGCGGVCHGGYCCESEYG